MNKINKTIVSSIHSFQLKLITVFLILTVVSMSTIPIYAAEAQATDATGGSGGGSGGSSSGGGIDYSKPPMYLFVSNPTIIAWCNTDCRYNKDYYMTIVVRVTDIKLKNWKSVPVTIDYYPTTGGSMSQTIKTDSKGEATFVFELSDYQTGVYQAINLIATSPKSGRKAYYDIQWYVN